MFTISKSLLLDRTTPSESVQDKGGSGTEFEASQDSVKLSPSVTVADPLTSGSSNTARGTLYFNKSFHCGMNPYLLETLGPG